MMIGGADSLTSAADGSKSSAAGAKLEDDLNRFLNLLVTQLQNQDPLDPLDANEFTSQLVQFASVEQQIYQNSNLEKMLNLQETSQIASMVEFIDNQVEFIGDKLPLENGIAEFSYVMPAGVAKGTITIANASGVTVFTADADTSLGKHGVTWDGKDKNNIQLSDGDYTAIVNGTDAFGDLVEIQKVIKGTVSGAGVDDGIVKLFLGNNITINQSDVLTVARPKVVATADP